MSTKARQAREAIRLLAEQTRTAAIRRNILANAHAAWYANKDRDEADMNLEAALIADGSMTEEQAVESIHREGTTIYVLFDDGQALELDAYGNILTGAAE